MTGWSKSLQITISNIFRTIQIVPHCEYGGYGTEDFCIAVRGHGSSQSTSISAAHQIVQVFPIAQSWSSSSSHPAVARVLTQFRPRQATQLLAQPPAQSQSFSGVQQEPGPTQPEHFAWTADVFAERWPPTTPYPTCASPAGHQSCAGVRAPARIRGPVSRILWIRAHGLQQFDHCRQFHVRSQLHGPQQSVHGTWCQLWGSSTARLES